MIIDKIVFPKRKGVIKEVKKTKPFGTNDGSQMFGVIVEMVNGDNFQHYDTDKSQIDQFVTGRTLEYVMVKTKDDDDKVKNRLKSFNIEKKKVVRSRPLIQMLDSIRIEDLLFIDIETVRIEDKLVNKTPLFESWQYKRRKEGETLVSDLKKSFEDKAPLYAEFGKIVCVSLGIIRKDQLVVQSYYGDDEAELLKEVVTAMGRFYKAYDGLRLCGHSIVGFDIPFMLRRLIINGIRVPKFLDVVNVKPWILDEDVVDIARIWKNTGFYGASLINIAVALGLDSPKQEIDGSMVSDTYYRKKNGLETVTKYCEQDVFATVNIMRKMYNKPVFDNFISKTFEHE